MIPPTGHNFSHNLNKFGMYWLGFNWRRMNTLEDDYDAVIVQPFNYLFRAFLEKKICQNYCLNIPEVDNLDGWDEIIF